MKRFLGHSFAVAAMVLGTSVVAQEAAPIDFGALLDSCNEAPAECQAALSAQIAAIEALPVAAAVKTEYLQTIATVAASAAGTNRTLGRQMADVVAKTAVAVEKVAKTAPSSGTVATPVEATQSVVAALENISSQLEAGDAVDLSAIGGSPS
ncbi:hypothetical protein [Thalassobius sp. Cn5-15]|uniref:hypothetical protein n=1 Tax=Thalassobius sp. Cn5-15 TaxID=2917763 RepID=UPI001EF1C2D9|nr:hypothetical protein [Thalassobius sp. Cn5-15]MCG7494016.1 hypothetical protein [Thalassobius sp. Cn5-15]